MKQENNIYESEIVPNRMLWSCLIEIGKVTSCKITKGLEGISKDEDEISVILHAGEAEQLPCSQVAS